MTKQDRYSKMTGINDQFYESLFASAGTEIRTAFLKLEGETDIKYVVREILNKRLSNTIPLSSQDVSTLLHLIRRFPDQEARLMVLEASRKLRKKIFGNKVAVMVPIEMSSFCSSNCQFCGWRSNNVEMIRLKLSKQSLIDEVKFLAQLGYTHFELSAGDDLNLIRLELPEFIASVKKTIREVVREARLSICLTPFPEAHYQHLARYGLDCVLTWQETYDHDTYYRHITAGPKAKGLKEDLSIDPNGSGYLFRMKSHENAVRSGLQVGLGIILGLSTQLEADILSLILHGNELIRQYRDSIEPLIIGMPTWNPITTPHTDNLRKYTHLDLKEPDFELISAIYLLGFPDHHAWVFPNCRVSKTTQLRSITTAGCFTSTMVRLRPGAYLAEASNTASVLNGEQFTHTFDLHENYLSLFKDAQLEIVPDEQFLFQKKRRVICG